MRSTDLFFPIIKGFVKGEFVPIDPLLPPFGGAKGVLRRVGALTKPCKRLRDAEGEMKLWHNLCHQSLRLISFATSLYTREAFADRRDEICFPQ